MVDNVGDVVTEVADEGTDTVRASVSRTLEDHVENLVLTGAGNINGTGNALNNQLTGNSGANILTGSLGNDTIEGGGGIDTAVVVRPASRWSAWRVLDIVARPRLGPPGE